MAAETSHETLFTQKRQNGLSAWKLLEKPDFFPQTKMKQNALKSFKDLS